MLTNCLQAEVFSDLLVVTWMREVKDAVASEVHLEDDNKDEKFPKENHSMKSHSFYCRFLNVCSGSV